MARGQCSKGSDDHRGGDWGVASHRQGQAEAVLGSGRGSCSQGGSRNNNCRDRRLLSYQVSTCLYLENMHSLAHL